MSTSERPAALRSPAVKPAAWILAAAMAAVAVYLAVAGASPLWTLAAGIGVGALIATAMRDRGGDR